MNPTSNDQDPHYRCLDLFPVKGTAAGMEARSSEDGILVEVWSKGGLLHISLPVAVGSLLEFAPVGHTLQGLVTCCRPDEVYGFIVTVSISQDQRGRWFPENYCPPQLYDKDKEKQVFQRPPNLAGELSYKPTSLIRLNWCISSRSPGASSPSGRWGNT